MKSTLICGLPSEIDVEDVISSLKDAGFRITDIWVFMPAAKVADHDIGDERSASVSSAESGGSPGLIMAILCGAAKENNGWRDFTMQDDHIIERETKFQDGNIVLCVQTGSEREAEKAEQILKAAAASDIKFLPGEAMRDRETV